MRVLCLTSQLLVLAISATALAADGVETKQEAPRKELSPDVAAVLAPTIYKVTADGKEVCEIWLAKQWEAKAKFAPTLSVLYPFQPGELIGAVRFPKRNNDFRNQQFRSGVYTLRYGLQPEDGNHVGTSQTRDFLVLLPAGKDEKPQRMDEKAMFKLSKLVTEATHPAILSMLPVADKSGAAAVRHIADRELWTVRLSGKAKAGDKVADLPIEFVVVGHAPDS
jgi:hypothetical protein